MLSDIHLADAEPPHPRNPLWKRFKRPEFFVDGAIRDFLETIESRAGGPIELVFNGDTFDFDSVMKMPSPRLSKDAPFPVSWLERARGLRAEEPKSRFKMKTILDDHPVFVEALRGFLARGHRVVFVLGNHDIELHWPSVQADLRERLGAPEGEGSPLRFVEWFYISNGDTLIEHGNQYDPYCLCANPINPLIRKHHGASVRLPFGNLAGRYMLNGMGLMNPHSDSSFIRGSVWGYLSFYYKYIMRTQPFLLWTWFWSALVTLFATFNEGFRPALADPITVPDRVEHIAAKSNGTPRMVWALRALQAHAAWYDPFRVLRELWLDRAILLGLVVFASFQFFSFLNVFSRVSIAWFLVPLAILTPAFLFYARSVRSEVERSLKGAFSVAPTVAKITGVRRVINGHTHLATHTSTEGIEYLNTGTWSPAFRDVACTEPYGQKCFAWIRPEAEGRVAELIEWTPEFARREAPRRAASS